MPTNQTAVLSSSFRLFLWGSAFLLLINLLIVNDLAEIWNPWEASNLLTLQEGTSLNDLGLPSLLLSTIYESLGLRLFVLRLPGVLLVLLGLGIWYYLGRPIFGKMVIWDTFVVLASSFTLVFSGKLAVNDAWLFTAQLTAFLALIRFLKRPNWQWGIFFLLVFLLGIWIHPWSMTIFSVVAGLLLRWRHPQGKVLDRLFLWLSLPLLFFTSAFSSGFIFTYGAMSYWKYLGLMFLGLLPWTGFLVASLPDLIYKLRKGEEMALILSALFLAALAAQSLVLTAALALLIARQLSAYFHPNYPYKNWVKGFAILHLLFSFFAITVFLLAAYTQIGGIGFRAGMAVGAIYWMLTFAGVIGLYANQSRLIVGGMAWGGMLAFFLFWVQVFPLLESSKLSAKGVIEKVNEMDKAPATIYIDNTIISVLPSLSVYAQEKGFIVNTNSEAGQRTGIFISQKSGKQQAPNQAIDEIELAANSWMTRDSIRLFIWKPQ